MRRPRMRKPRNILQKRNFISGMAKKMARKMTWPEREFAKMMKELGVECEPQKIVGMKIFDFFLPQINTLIEVDGTYFHAHPDIYTEQNSMQKRNVKNDKFKDVLARGLGYKIERVWEKDLKENYEGVKKKIRDMF